jgi:hypothetical protein
MCYIFCMTSTSVYTTLGTLGDFEGGSRGSALFFLRKHVTFFPCFSCHLDFHVHCWVVFRHMVFVNGFLFLVKELGLLTNPSHWVRVLDVVGSYMYIVL